MTHTAKQMIPAIGNVVAIRFESVEVECLVVDAKSSWGKARLLVAPLKGNGSQWVEEGRVLRLVSTDQLVTA